MHIYILCTPADEPGNYSSEFLYFPQPRILRVFISPTAIVSVPSFYHVIQFSNNVSFTAERNTMNLFLCASLFPNPLLAQHYNNTSGQKVSGRKAYSCR